MFKLAVKFAIVTLISLGAPVGLVIFLSVMGINVGATGGFLIGLAGTGLLLPYLLDKIT